jgi:hypothetical protein
MIGKAENPADRHMKRREVLRTDDLKMAVPLSHVAPAINTVSFS